MRSWQSVESAVLLVAVIALVGSIIIASTDALGQPEPPKAADNPVAITQETHVSLGLLIALVGVAVAFLAAAMVTVRMQQRLLDHMAQPHPMMAAADLVPMEVCRVRHQGMEVTLAEIKAALIALNQKLDQVITRAGGEVR
jgi:hypothetical protein